VSRWLLLFDIDGTLLASRGGGLEAMHAAFQEVFAAPPQPVSVRPHGMTDPILFEIMAAAYGVEPAALAAAQARLTDVYVRRLAALLARPGSVELKPGIARLLRGLRERGDADLGLVSGNIERAAWLKLAAGGVARYFGAGAFGSDSRDRGELVALAIGRCSAAAGAAYDRRRIWMIGDTPIDVASGRAHGTRTLAVATGMHDEATLQAAAADVVLADCSDVDRVVDIICDGG
jgi:phosphoglycolate phosphatase-like HAD superfamily hydrolase